MKGSLKAHLVTMVVPSDNLDLTKFENILYLDKHIGFLNRSHTSLKYVKQRLAEIIEDNYWMVKRYRKVS